MTKRLRTPPVRQSATQGHRRFGKPERQLALVALGITLMFAGMTTMVTIYGGRHVARPVNAHGLRVTGRGRSDATHVLQAAMFSDLRVQRAYRIAALIPATLNRLYCWCGCIERGMRSNLECFESEHAAMCDICLAGAETAWDMHQKGITDPAKIQQVLDAHFAPRAAASTE